MVWRMARPRSTLGFVFARTFLAINGIVGVLLTINAVLEATSDDQLSREVPGRRTVFVTDPSGWLRTLDAAPSVLQGLVTAVVAWLVLIVVVDVQRGVPFEGRAARRFRISAWLVGLAVPAYGLLTGWAAREAYDAAGRRGSVFVASFEQVLFDGLTFFLVAALLAVFSHAFQEGNRLASDADGLV